MALTDALGTLAGFRLRPGQAHDLRGTAALIEGLSCQKLPADRAFDANRVREALAEAVIPPKIQPPPSGRVRLRHPHMAAPDRDLLRKAQGIQGASPCAAAKPTQATPRSSPSP